MLKPVLEVLAGVPTVVYGYFALTAITPFLKSTLFPDLGPINALSAIIVVGIMSVPMVSSLSDDAMKAVPRDLREAAYAVGATQVRGRHARHVPGRAVRQRRLLHPRRLTRGWS